MSEDLTQEQLKIAGKVQKLLNLAAKAGTEEEAASAAAMAQELLIKYNLDMAALGDAKEDARENAKTGGGFYNYQRILWQAISDLNFCLYVIQMYRSTDFRYVDENGMKSMQKGEGKTRQKVSVVKYRHSLVGKKINTTQTINMAEYLQNAIERVVRDGSPCDANGRWVASYRYGCTASVVEKLQEKRLDYLRKEKYEQAAKAKAAGGNSTGTSLTLTDYVQSEEDANQDFIHGEGYSAKMRAKRVQLEKELEQARKEHDEWYEKLTDAERNEYDKEQAKASKGRKSYGRSSGSKIDYSAYSAGKAAGKSIGIDPQVSKGKVAGRLN